MATTLEQYSTDGGIAIGAVIGATTASLAGLTFEFAVIVGFGILGGVRLCHPLSTETRDSERELP